MSVYGKKIVIDGVEYVAQKDTDTLDCSGCYFQKKHCENIEEKLKEVFGNDCAKGRYILKKVTPKKKPEKIKLAKVEATRGTNLSSGTMTLEQLSMPKSNDKFIVCLSEPDGLKPSDVPKQHHSEADAIKEAERLCKKCNQKFVVLKVVAEVEPEIKPKITKRG